MIYLLEGDSFVEVDDWQKICARPSYLENLVVKGRKLERIIGYYELPEKVKCGLSNCHTRHFKGYVVETDNSSETNIGHNCGTKYFDVQFETMSSEFLNALEFAKAKAFIVENKSRVFEYWQKVNALAVGQKNATWAIDLYSKINSSEIIGLAAYRALRQMQANGNGNVTTTRLPTAKEIELAQTAGQPVPQSVEVIVGFISNIDFLSPDNDLSDIYNIQLRGVVQNLQDAEPEKMSRTQMRPIVSGISALNTKIEKAKEIIETARLFFTQENLSQLLKHLEDNQNISSADVDRYKKFLACL
ncbi:TPA: hypothetical protein ACP4WM_000216 [Escherichia coli]|uniref:hypothetical protein n=1 Tax=Escherichia coli TaxID=562 RepID=UPI0006A1C2BB|nr:hypothetical protein [Escherichia coli]EFH2872218.1 hypothetical protein [Escherichia coli]EFH7367339.1 hypothetical protein [Escherichia coli]EGI7150995.1 hypothetical protein [Escherichia coli]EHW7469820.1 hypothetical protein [Escherichia coli]EHX8040591.1 hypothetical protein [Escherichia coli]